MKLTNTLLVACATVMGVLAQTEPSLESRIVLLNLGAWTQQHTTALVNANTKGDLDDAIDAFISKNVNIQVNGAKVHRGDFVKTLEANLPGRVDCNATYTSVIEVPADEQNPTTAGWVGMAFITNSEYASKTVTQRVSDNILIQQDPSIPVPSTVAGIRGDFDGRRVVAINRVTTVV